MNETVLRKELLARRNADQASRSAVAHEGKVAFDRVVQIDDDNGAWLENVLNQWGWPLTSQVGEEGSHAAGLLAQHADRRPVLQRRCLELLKEAAANGEASPADLARLTDRVLLAGNERQIYGTQMAQRDGEFVACRLECPESVNERRTSVGLGTLEDQLREALELHGPPKPAHMPCPNCGGDLEVWPPELGGEASAECPGCRRMITVRPVAG